MKHGTVSQVLYRPLFHSSWNEQPQPTCWCTNLTHLTNLTDRLLIFAMIFGPIEGTRNTRGARIDRCVRCSADIEFCKLIVIDIGGVRGVPLADLLDLSCLYCLMSPCSSWIEETEATYIFLEFRIRADLDKAVCKAERT